MFKESCGQVLALFFLSNTFLGFSADYSPSGTHTSLGFTSVFVGGQDGYACFRIPAMVTTTKGTVLAVADGRITNCHDIPNPLDLVLKRSTNNGKSWGPLQVIADYGKNTNDTETYAAYDLTNPVPRVAAGDAALSLDRSNGRVWVLYDNGAYVRGKPHNRALKLELRFSDDDGATWSPGIDLEAQNPGLRPEGADFMAAPGNGIQLLGGPHAGRLIFAAYIWNKPFFSTVIYSDDHGKHWKRGGISAQGGGETQIAETAPGHLLVTIRNNTFPEKGVRFFNRSSDGGETWGKPFYENANQPALPDPKCQASLLRVNENLLALANAADASSRVRMTLRLSKDGGETWPVSQVIYPGASAYSALSVLSNGDLGMLVEMDNYQRICFVRRSCEGLTKP